MYSTWEPGGSKLKQGRAGAEGGIVVETDERNLRRDEENGLALVSEWSEWERNLAFAQGKWQSGALQRETWSCMIWA